MDKKSTQLAGEYYTLAKLYEKGFTAMKAPEGMELLDIVVVDKKGVYGGLPIQVKASENAYVEVKRKTKEHQENYYKFSIGGKIHKIEGDRFIYIFVNMNKGNPQFFIVPVRDVKNYVNKYKWCDEGNFIFFEIRDIDREKYEDNWDLIKRNLKL